MIIIEVERIACLDGVSREDVLVVEEAEGTEC